MHFVLSRMDAEVNAQEPEIQYMAMERLAHIVGFNFEVLHFR